MTDCFYSHYAALGITSVAISLSAHISIVLDVMKEMLLACSVKVSNDIIHNNIFRNVELIQFTELCTNNAIRLRDSTTPTNGRLQVCVNGMWKTICSDELWDDHDATVVCRQLGFAPHGTYH